MTISFKIKKLLLDLFETKEILGATEISKTLGISRTITHKALKTLLESGKIEKVGSGSHTRYKSFNFSKGQLLKDSGNKNEYYNADFKTQKTLNEIFLKFTPNGEILEGFHGLKKWCETRNFNIEEKVKSYMSINSYIEKLQNSCGLLDAKKSFGKCFDKVFLDEIFYSDQYTYLEFGRGKLAELTFYAKQSQNKNLINRSIDEIFIKLDCIIRKEKFDAIAIVPWSIDRKNQLLKFLKERLIILGLPFVNIIKYYPNDIAIPQKSLKTREQRIENAKTTIFINDKNIKNYKKIFLIDDFVGSGSTLNETAKKLKDEGIEKVFGFAFVGNMDLDYEVVNEI